MSSFVKCACGELVPKSRMDLHECAFSSAADRKLPETIAADPAPKATPTKRKDPSPEKKKKKQQQQQKKKSPAKKRAKKDGDAEKKPRALSAYNLFVMEARPAILRENPGIANTEIMKEAGARWKALSDAEKAAFKKKAEERAAASSSAVASEEKKKDADNDAPVAPAPAPDAAAADAAAAKDDA